MTRDVTALTIVGLGPGDPGLRTVDAARTLASADRIILRTGIHPGVADLLADSRVTTCDDLYVAGRDFDTVYAAVADRVVDAARSGPGSVVFAVPGHPRFGERSVGLVVERATAAGIPVAVQGAVSLVDAVATAVGHDPVAEQAQLVDAADLAAILDAEPFAGGQLAVDPSRPLLVTQLYDAEKAAATKLALSRLYPDDHPVLVVRAAGVPGGEEIVEVPLHGLDRLAVDHLTSAWVSPLPRLDAVRSPQTLQRIVARLRAPDGCPWDREQTHQTIRKAVIEEAYETADAIDADDSENLAEELGDLLLQVALHSQIAEEAGTFTLEDVHAHVSAKLLRRHPHVFGDVDASTPADVVRTWDAVKAAERAAAGASPKPTNPLERLPRSMPAFDKAVVLLTPRKGEALREVDAAATAAAGNAILDAIANAAAVGIEPEAALAAALRQRYGPTNDNPTPDGKERG